MVWLPHGRAVRGMYIHGHTLINTIRRLLVLLQLLVLALVCA